MVYLLNFMRLERGKALFLGPNEPHAYVSGDMMECMAASDNTVRAGLTSKFRDVDTLCSMLTYATGRPKFVDRSVVTAEGNSRQEIYTPPVDDFLVSSVVISDAFQLDSWDSAMICMVEKGRGRVSTTKEHKGGLVVSRGDTFLVPAGRKLYLENVDRNSGDFVLWTSCVNCPSASSSPSRL